MHGWQSESSDGLKGGGSRAFFGMVAVVTSSATAGCSVV